MSRIPSIIDDAQNLVRISTLESEVAALQAVVGHVVASGDTSMAITFGTAMPDANYGVLALPDWNTTLYLSALAASGFTLAFGTAPTGTGHKVRYLVVGT